LRLGQLDLHHPVVDKERPKRMMQIELSKPQ
jgi:hypothetical protein